MGDDVPRLGTCDVCGGEGPVTCSTCDGAGRAEIAALRATFADVATRALAACDRARAHAGRWKALGRKLRAECATLHRLRGFAEDTAEDFHDAVERAQAERDALRAAVRDALQHCEHVAHQARAGRPWTPLQRDDLARAVAALRAALDTPAAGGQEGAMDEECPECGPLRGGDHAEWCGVGRDRLRAERDRLRAALERIAAADDAYADDACPWCGEPDDHSNECPTAIARTALDPPAGGGEP